MLVFGGLTNMGENDQPGSYDKNAMLYRFDVPDIIGDKRPCKLVLGGFVDGIPTELMVSFDKPREEYEAGMLSCISTTASLVLKAGTPWGRAMINFGRSREPILREVFHFAGGLPVARSDVPPRPRLEYDAGNGITFRLGFAGDDNMAYLNVLQDGASNVASVSLVVGADGGFPQEVTSCITAVASEGLKHGLPLENLVECWKGTCFGPAGITKDPEIPVVKSYIDYAARYLENKFLRKEEKAE